MSEPFSKRNKWNADDPSLDVFLDGLGSAYKGCRIRDTTWQIPVVKNDISPQEFFERFVQTRTPCVIKGHLRDSAWKGDEWTDDKLLARAGEDEIWVEERSTSDEAYGRDNKVKMQFGKLIELVASGDDKHYLTTQSIPTDEESGQPAALYAAPLPSLEDIFPLKPSLFQNLEPYQLNMWFGNNLHGSSSGLHHDFHDNLYVLLRGRKRFRLYSPEQAEVMYTNGKICKIHSNGLINYVSGGGVTAADGACPSDQEGMTMEIISDTLAQFESAEEEGSDNPLAPSRTKYMERVLEAMMDQNLEDAADTWEEGDSEAGDGASASSSKEPLYPFEASEGDGGKGKRDPDNFSAIPVDVLNDDKAMKENYAHTYAYARAAMADIHAGDMLYLPASWFHEVTSYGVDTSAQASSHSSTGKGHLAFNYWVHPPSENGTFDKPYDHDNWSKLTRDILARQRKCKGDKSQKD